MKWTESADGWNAGHWSVLSHEDGGGLILTYDGHMLHWGDNAVRLMNLADRFEQFARLKKEEA